MEMRPEANLGHIWVFFITQTKTASAIIEGVFNHGPPEDLGNKNYLREKSSRCRLLSVRKKLSEKRSRA